MPVTPQERVEIPVAEALDRFDELALNRETTHFAISGIILTDAGVAAADQERPAGGDNSSTQPSCGAGDIDFAQGCFLGWGRFFT
ncbi:MAG: hypothetical protein ACRDRX_17100 [Pseudonocardiaceae bacterium]